MAAAAPRRRRGVIPSGTRRYQVRRHGECEDEARPPAGARGEDRVRRDEEGGEGATPPPAQRIAATKPRGRSGDFGGEVAAPSGGEATGAVGEEVVARSRWRPRRPRRPRGGRRALGRKRKEVRQL